MLSKGQLGSCPACLPVRNGPSFTFLPARMWGDSGLAPWAPPVVNLLFLNVKPAFSGHCVILFTTCLWGLLINRFSPTVYFFLSLVLGHIFKLHGLLMTVQLALEWTGPAAAGQPGFKDIEAAD